mmetsp:Transcript_12515/g.41274  ORF Transcript_12515/g.41274 Transcript_12515/m.41274 type:complete len:257 (-) Transcript_12515:1535-2305(-)
MMTGRRRWLRSRSRRRRPRLPRRRSARRRSACTRRGWRARSATARTRLRGAGPRLSASARRRRRRPSSPPSARLTKRTRQTSRRRQTPKQRRRRRQRRSRPSPARSGSRLRSRRSSQKLARSARRPKKQSGGGGGSPAGFLFGRVFGVAFFAGAALAARQALTKGAVAPDALVEELKGATEGLSTKQIAVAVGAVLAALLADGFLNLPLLNLVFPALAQIGGLATAGVLAARYTWGDASPEEDFEGVKKSVTTLID